MNTLTAWAVQSQVASIVEHTDQLTAEAVFLPQSWGHCSPQQLLRQVPCIGRTRLGFRDTSSSQSLMRQCWEISTAPVSSESARPEALLLQKDTR